MNVSEVWHIYALIAKQAIPVTFIFGVCNIAYDIISRAFFSGRLHFGGRF